MRQVLANAAFSAFLERMIALSRATDSERLFDENHKNQIDCSALTPQIKEAMQCRAPTMQLNSKRIAAD